jgi:glutaredoxin-like protein
VAMGLGFVPGKLSGAKAGIKATGHRYHYQERAMLQEKEKKLIAEVFKGLKNPVKLVNFTQEVECQFCKETRELLAELAGLSDLVSLQVYDFQSDKQKADAHGVDKIPATVVQGEKDYGVRYYGFPGGYEFAALLADVVNVSVGQTDLKPQTQEALSKIEKPVHLQVFVSPTCPYCPGAVILAHKFAIECDLISADMVETSEFPHLVQKYQVMGVPKTVVNGEFSVLGAVPEEKLLEEITKAAHKVV